MSVSVKEEICKRGIPETIPADLSPSQWENYRGEKLKQFMKYEYGVTPPPPDKVQAIKEEDWEDWGGKARHSIIRLNFDTPRGEFGFRLDSVIPYSNHPLPAFVYLSFAPYPNGAYCPMEEIIDNGYAVFSIYYNDVTKDENDNFTSGIAAMYPRRGDGTDWGKIGMWAFAASRAMDYITTVREIDPGHVFTAGHSRLGKTALWCAAQDERFAGAVVNNSGCHGAAILRGKTGEHISDSIRQFSYWYCDNLALFSDKEDEWPVDQHQLLALIAPRLLCVGCSSEDSWADPFSEYLAVVLASESSKMLGLSGLIGNEDRMVPIGTWLGEGNISYHLRKGTHFLGRNDWQTYMRFINKHMHAVLPK